MFNIYLIIFSTSLIMGTLISVSSYSWIGMWIGMEINLLSIIPLINNSKNIFASESSLKYFISQTLASLILMFSIILLMTFTNSLNNLNSNSLLIMIMNSSLLTKMGAAPFHFWFPEIIEGLNWNNTMLMLTWQKIAPMILLMYNMNTPMFITIIILSSMMISGILGINQISLRKILVYSSINHMGWMISSMMFLETIWITYFLVYSLMTLNICLMFKMMNSFFMKQLFFMFNFFPSTKLFFSLNFLSLGGLPPFIGFMPKWLTIQLLIENKMILTSLIMVIMTLLTLYFYIRITFSSILLFMNEPNWLIQMKFFNKNTKFIMTINLITILGLILCTINFNWL